MERTRRGWATGPAGPAVGRLGPRAFLPGSRYVEGMVGLFYMTDEAVRDDPELQA